MSNIVITTVGLSKIAAATTDAPLNLSKFAVGDGGGKAITPVADMTSLVNEKFRDFLNSKYAEDNKTVIECVLRRDAPIDKEFTIRELGVFDNEGDMVAIASVPDALRPVTSANITTELIWNIVLDISNSENITINLQEGVFATQDALNREIQNRTDADNGLDNKITDNKTTLNALQTQVNDLIATLNNYHKRRVGTKFAHSGSTAPEGALVCDGSFVKIEDYQDLFNIVGHKYNSGNDPKDGTFKLPDHRERYSRGSSTTPQIGAYQEDELKGHSHTAGTLQLNLPRIQGYVTSGGDYGFDAFTYANGVLELGARQGYRASTHSYWIDGVSNELFFDSYNVGATMTIQGGSGNTSSTGGAETRPKTVVDLWCIWYE